jgi:hypothetical protein
MTIPDLLIAIFSGWAIQKGQKYLDRAADYLKKGVKKHGKIKQESDQVDNN